MHYDEKGRRAKGSKARVEYIGFEKYRRELQIEAGQFDPEFEQLVEDLKKSDDFWGEMPPLEGNEPVTDG